MKKKEKTKTKSKTQNPKAHKYCTNTVETNEKAVVSPQKSELGNKVKEREKGTPS